MTGEALVHALASAIRAAVRPRLGGGREVVGLTDGGDASFAIDQIAEEAVERFCAEHDLRLAVYSEDRGLVGAVDAEDLLVIDPIDGSRPAKCGFESCCVSVALADNKPAATIADVRCAAVYELRSERLFLATRGGGARLLEEGQPQPLRLSRCTEPTSAALSLELAGRPVGPVALALAELIDGASLRGGVFCFASTTFALTRLLTGQLDGHLDVGERLVVEWPERAGSLFGGGRPAALFPYDLAAVVPIVTEAGAVVTDAYGRSLERVPLLEVRGAGRTSCVAAGNPTLHRALLEAVERGIARFGEES